MQCRCTFCLARQLLNSWFIANPFALYSMYGNRFCIDWHWIWTNNVCRQYVLLGSIFWASLKMGNHLKDSKHYWMKIYRTKKNWTLTWTWSCNSWCTGIFLLFPQSVFPSTFTRTTMIFLLEGQVVIWERTATYQVELKRHSKLFWALPTTSYFQPWPYIRVSYF